MDRYTPALNGTAFMGMVKCVTGGDYVLYSDAMKEIEAKEKEYKSLLEYHAAQKRDFEGELFRLHLRTQQAYDLYMNHRNSTQRELRKEIAALATERDAAIKEVSKWGTKTGHLEAENQRLREAILSHQKKCRGWFGEDLQWEAALKEADDD